MLLVANLANTKWYKKTWKWLKPWQMGTHLKVLSESFPMNTNMTCLDGFQKSLCSCDLDESSLSIGRVNSTCAAQKHPDHFGNIQLFRAFFWKYLYEKCWWQPHPQLLFRCFVNLGLISSCYFQIIWSRGSWLLYNWLIWRVLKLAFSFQKVFSLYLFWCLEQSEQRHLYVDIFLWDL